MRQVLERATQRELTITVPADVVAEWWRARTDLRESILACVDVEPLTEELAKIAGEAMAAVRSSTLVDAIVMASAARRGDVERLRRHFPSVRVFSV